MGTSETGRLLIASHTMTEGSFASLAHANQPLVREKFMSKVDSKIDDDELQPEDDLAQLKGRTRGKYVERYRAGTNLVLLDPDVAAAFPDAKSANDALRLLIKVAESKVPRHS
jgi:hypothetical protein